MIHIVLGTKAQLIKMAPVMNCLKKRGVAYNFIHTGQHKETMEDMLADFNLKNPDVRLYDGEDIVSVPKMLKWGVLTLLKCLRSQGEIFQNDKQGIVLVHGDTFSTVLGALMGRVAGLKVGHVESGLRSFNLFNPFPEELTRIITFRLSHILFCPGEWAMENVVKLQKEKINTNANTMIDTLSLAPERFKRKDHVPEHSFALASIHRYENIFNKKRLEHIITLLEHIACTHHLVFILHPPTEKRLRKTRYYERLESNTSIELHGRYSYFDFTALLHESAFVITDGGSLQEETSYLGIPCLLLRKKTERKEGLEKNVVLSNFDLQLIDNFIHNYKKYRAKRTTQQRSPSEIIADFVRDFQ